MEKSKLNFFQQIRFAITKPIQYYKLTKVSGGRMTGFVFLFVLLLSLFTIIPLLYETFGPNGINHYLHEELPAFELSNGELYVADRYEEDDNGTYILIDTSVEKFSDEDISGLYDQEILISKTNIVNSQLGKTQIISFSDLGGLHFDNKIINVLMPFIYLIIILIAIFIYVFMVAGYFFTALLYSIVGMIVSAITHTGLRYGTLYKTAIYGKVTAGILSAILGIIPVSIPGFLDSGLAILITCAYVVYGTLSHNRDEAREDSGINTQPPQNFY